MSGLEVIPLEVKGIMEQSGLSSDEFESLRARLVNEPDLDAQNHLEGAVRAPDGSDIGQLPEATHRTELVQDGLGRILRGEVGLVILNGGMATRFGGVVKGTVSVSEHHSFLALKLLDALRVSKQADAEPMPILLMNSRATSNDTRKHLEANDWFGYPKEKVWFFEQCWSVRLRRDGSLYRDSNGLPSYHGPGHGDLPFCLRRSGLLERFVAQGGKTLLMSNVDNVVATLDPAILAWHAARPEFLTAEMAPLLPGDRGGMPLWVDNHLQIVEAFRIPPSVDTESIGVLNTNTIWIDVEAIQQERALEWFRVVKTVEGQEVVQFERLVGQLSAFFPTAFLRVQRDGPDGRFLPIKAPSDLDEARDALLANWIAR